MLNDWSARDIQGLEMIPLGPFTAKNFATTISHWIITPEALAPFKTPLLPHDHEVLPYLQDKNLSAYDICLEASIQTPQMAKNDSSAWHSLAKSNMKYLYYSVN